MKKTMFTFLFLGCVALFPNPLASQVLPYYFSVENGVYSNLTDTTSLNNGEVWDDPTFIVPIGFEIELFGKNYDTLFNFEALGAILFAINSGDNILPTLIPMGDDLIDRGDLIGQSMSPISYKTEGNPGNQICKIEWQNAGFYNELSELTQSLSFVNLQMWLYEANGDIEFRYGPSHIEDAAICYEGNQGPVIGLIDSVDLFANELGTFWYLSDDPNDPDILSVGEIIDFPGEVPDLLTGTPQDGIIYKFSLSPTNVHQINYLENVKIYPTLTEGVLYVESSEITPLDLVIMNPAGKLIFEQKHVRDGATILLDGLTSGLYFVKLYNKNGSYIEKIFKL